jgi:hypothetical protein
MLIIGKKIKINKVFRGKTLGAKWICLVNTGNRLAAGLLVNPRAVFSLLFFILKNQLFRSLAVKL